MNSEMRAYGEQGIPVTSSQLALLRFLDHPRARPEARAAFTVSKAFILRPQLDLERLRLAFGQVTKRHEVFRTRFYRKASGYGAYLESDPSQLLFVENVRDEAEARQRAGAIVQSPIDISQPLFALTLIRFGTDVDIVVPKMHHLIGDGYSIALLLKEAIKAYQGLELPPVELNVERYVAEFDHVGRPGSFGRRDAFLRNLFKDPPPVPNIGRKAKGLRPNVDLVNSGPVGEIRSSVSIAEHEALLALAKQVGTTVTGLMTAAFAKTIGEAGRVEDVILQVPVARRSNRLLRNYVNFVSTDVPVRVDLAQSTTLPELAKSIDEGVSKALAFAPFMDSNYLGPVLDEAVAQDSYTALYFSGNRSLGRWMDKTRYPAIRGRDASTEIDLGLVSLVPIDPVQYERSHIGELDLRNFPASDGLGFALAYDTSGFDLPEAEQFLADVIARLTGR